MLSCYSHLSGVEWRHNYRKIYSSGHPSKRYFMHIGHGYYNLSFNISSLNDSGIFDCFGHDGGPKMKSYNLTVVDGNCFHVAVIYFI